MLREKYIKKKREVFISYIQLKEIGIKWRNKEVAPFTAGTFFI